MFKNTLSALLIFLSMAHCIWAQKNDATIEESFNKAFLYHYSDKDSAYYYYEKTIKLANQENDIDHIISGLSYLMNANGNYYDLVDYERNIKRQDSILNYDNRLKKYEYADYYRDYLLFERGNYNYKLKDYATSKKHFLKLQKKLLDIPEEELFAPDFEMLSSINSFLGLIYRHTSKFEQAELTYKKDLELLSTFKDSIEDWESNYFNTKKLLSQVYEEKGEFSRANDLLKENLAFCLTRSENRRYKNNLLSALVLLAKNFVKQEEYDQAILVFNELFFDYSSEPPFSFEIDLLKAEAHFGLSDFPSALIFYEKALKKAIAFRNGTRHQDVAEIKGKIADFFKKQGEFDKGLDWIGQALVASAGNFKKNNLVENPSPYMVFSKRQLLQLLDIKLQLLQIAHSETGDKKYLEAAMQSNKDIMSTFDLLKKEFDSKLDKQFLAEIVYPIFHRMLGITFEAYQQDKSPVLFELALNISEKNKDFLLLEALRSANATEYGSVPKKVVKKEARLRAEISNTEKNLFDTTEEESVYSEELFKLKQEYYGFLDTLESKYSKYHDLKYQSKSLSLGGVRGALENDEVLISFTMVSDQLYTLISDENTEDFVRLPFDESNRESVREFYRLISNSTIKDNSQIISELATMLYEKILKLPLTNFESDNLTIIPDDVLHYLPFDLLKKDEELLLQSKFIGYGNSISSYLELKGKQKGNAEKLLAFAPSFSGAVVANSERQFGKLLYNNDEVKRIGSVFETEIYSENEATLENFKTIAPEFDVIHLATHASANDEYPDYSYLAFSEEDGDGNVLYIKDLYNTSLKADLVTLSACQTGIGKLQKGQGMMSLSKGFFYAGAKSLVNTLWKINDKSSVKLMEYFYDGLSEGKNKKEALRDAKLKYLETTDDNLLKHPYYWSAFVVSGDIAPITNTYNWWYIGLGAALVVLLMVFAYSKGKRKII